MRIVIYQGRINRDSRELRLNYPFQFSHVCIGANGYWSVVKITVAIFLLAKITNESPGRRVGKVERINEFI